MEPLSAFAISFALKSVINICIGSDSIDEGFKKALGGAIESTISKQKAKGVFTGIKNAFKAALKDYCKNKDIRDRSENELYRKLNIHIANNDILSVEDKEISRFIDLFKIRLAEQPAAFNYLKLIHDQEQFDRIDKLLSQGKDEILDTLSIIIEIITQNGEKGQNKIEKQLTSSPICPSVFIGRKSKLEELREQLVRGDHFILLVNGQGGIGKSTLAAKYYHTYQKKYKHVGWVTSEKSLFSALMELGSSLLIQDELKQLEGQPNKQVELVISRLNRLSKPSLLVIDNVNEVEDLDSYSSGLKRLSNLHLILTSRIAEFEGFKTSRVDGLEEGAAIELFKHHYEKLTEADYVLLPQLINDVGRNTLVLELLAKNLKELNRNRRRYGLKELIADVENSLVRLSKSKKVRVNYQTNGLGTRNGKPEDIVMAMYDFTTLSDRERQLLSIFALLPTESIPVFFLDACFGEGHYDDELDSLSEKGWLDRYEGKVSMYRANQVVQDVTREVQKEQLFNDCEKMIEAIKYLGGGLLQNESWRTHLLARYASSIVNKLPDVCEVSIGVMCESLGIYYQSIGNLDGARRFFERMNVVFEKNHKAAPKRVEYANNLAISYERLGEIYKQRGDNQKALNFFEKQAALFEKLHKDSLERVELKRGLAISYSKLGTIYQQLGDNQKALNFFEQYSELSEELCEDSPESVEFKRGLAISHQFLGNIYQQMGDNQKALNFLEQYSELSEELCEDSPESVEFKNGLAISYSKLGAIYQQMGDNHKALNFFEQYRQLSEELYEDFPESVEFKNGLAISYQFLGNIYQQMRDNHKALNFFEKDLELSQELYEDSPESVAFKNGLATSYQFLGNIYQQMGDNHKALNFFEQYRQLSEELYEDSPENVVFKNGLAISCQFLGNIYQQMGDNQKALNFFEKQIDLFEQLHKDSPESVDFKKGLAISYQFLGNIYKQLGDNQKALSFFEQCRQLLEELYEDSPDSVDFKKGLTTSYSNLGDICKQLGNNHKALNFFEKDLKLSQELYEDSPENVDFKNGLAISYSNLGDIYQQKGDNQKALNFFEQYRKLSDVLLENSSQDVFIKYSTGDAYSKLGMLLQDAFNENDKALLYFRDAERIGEELVEVSPDNYEFVEFYRKVKQAITDLNEKMEREGVYI